MRLMLPVQYYRGNSTIGSTQRYGYTAIKDGEAFSTKVPMVYTNPTEGDYYARKCTQYIGIDGSAGTINAAEFIVAYGHSRFVIEPSMSLPLSFSISFNSTVDNVWMIPVTVSRTGQIL